MNSTVVDPKEIVKSASLKSASAIILVHNHPSGETTPSQDDIELTNCIVTACKVIDVKIMPKNTGLVIVPHDQLSLAIGK